MPMLPASLNPELNDVMPAMGDLRLFFLESGKTTPEAREFFAATLDAEERARRDRFPTTEAKDLFAMSHGLTRVALSRWCAEQYGTEINPADWRFTANRLGKPCAFLPDDRAEAPLFSLSHTRGAALVAVTSRGKIGVDLESARRLANALPLANRYFAPEECADVLSRPGVDLMRERFLHYWTLKEAYLKALGLGITRPLASFAFALEAGSARLLYDHDGIRDDWRFPILALPGDMMGAIARGMPPGS